MARAAIDESVSSLVVLNADGRGLELTFWIEADRCAHRLAAIAGPQRVVLLESMEGVATEPWPSSPPWQQVNASFASRGFPEAHVSLVHGDANRPPSVLLVGAAGSSHWSASIERIRVEGRQKPALTGLEECGHLPATGLLFDVACRAKSQPECLRSTYRIANPSQIVSGLSGSGQSALECPLLELQTDIGLFQLRGLPLGPTRPDSCPLCVSDELVQLVVPVGAYQGPTTFRWRYQLGLV